jgi:hypothetical protein
MRNLLNLKFILLLLSAYLNFGISYSQNAYPVTLSNPMDYDTIIETEPNFIWQTNITALQTDPRYSQRYVLCELQENQLKGEAIAVNTPILVLEDYPNTMYSYSSTTTPLEKGHTYVWQVSILFNSLIVDQSEPYQFTIQEPLDTLPRFHPVAFKNDAQYLPVYNGTIGLVTEETGDLNLAVNITLNGQTDQQIYLNEYLNGTLQTATTSPDVNKKRLLVLDIEALGLAPGNYSAEWIATPGKVYVFNFSIQ